jgi:hypothetical protein
LEAEVCTYYLFFDLLLSWQSFVKYKNRNSSYWSGIVFLIFFCNHLKNLYRHMLRTWKELCFSSKRRT